MLLLFLSLVPFGVPNTAHSAVIRDLKATLETCDSKSGTDLAIRRFQKDSMETLLLVDPNTLQTHQDKASRYTCAPADEKTLKKTRYGQLLEIASAPPYGTRNDGIRHATQKTEGVFLTVDLCPSRNKEFNREIFTAFSELGKTAPMPLGISVSGAWIDNHQKGFKWLREQSALGKLKITWIDHTKTHPYDHKKPLKENFMLEPGRSLETEIFGLETELLSRGLSPSVFFRFPGLVSNETLIKQLKSFGLISIGSDAWLAKGQTPKPGSIILIHGNENEPAGVTDFLNWIKELKDTPEKTFQSPENL